MRAASSTMIRWEVRCCSHIIGAQSDFMGTNAMSQDTDIGEKRSEAAADPCAPWGGLLASAGPRDHIVQLYQDQHFLNRAVCRFAAAALANGEGVILVPTAAHWEAFKPRLEAEGVDIDRATVRPAHRRRRRRPAATVHA